MKILVIWTNDLSISDWARTAKMISLQTGFKIYDFFPQFELHSHDATLQYQLVWLACEDLRLQVCINVLILTNMSCPNVSIVGPILISVLMMARNLKRKILWIFNMIKCFCFNCRHTHIYIAFICKYLFMESTKRTSRKTLKIKTMSRIWRLV